MAFDDDELNKPEPFTLHVEENLLSTTKQKLQLARYPVELEDLDKDDWRDGATVKRVKELAEYWKTKYDWRKQEVRMPTRFEHCPS